MFFAQKKAPERQKSAQDVKKRAKKCTLLLGMGFAHPEEESTKPAESEKNAFFSLFGIFKGELSEKVPFFFFFSKGKSKKVLEKKVKKMRIPRRRAQKKIPSVFGLAGYFLQNGQREWSYKGPFFH